MVLETLTVTLAGCALLVTPACTQSRQATPRADDARPVRATAGAEVGGDLEALIRRYQSDQSDVDRFYDLPWSDLRFDRLEQMYADGRDRLSAIDFDTLNQQGRIDYILLRNELTAEAARLALRRQRLGEMDAFLPFRRAVLDLEIARRRMESVDPQAAASKLAEIAEQIKSVRERIEKGRAAETTQPAESEPRDDGPLNLTPVTAQRTAGAVDALQRALHTWYSFYEGYEPAFSWWMDKPYDHARKALDEYANYLRKDIAGLKGEENDPLIGEPVGAAALTADLAEQVLPYAPEELIAVGEQQLAWCDTELKKAAAEMGFGDDWKAALAQIKEDHVPPGEQDDLATEFAREAIAFVKDHDLVTIPPLCEETWRLTMISPEGQKVLPFAAYGGQNIMIAYANAGMSQADKLMAMRGNNRHFSRSVMAHELIPGHHLQAFMSARNRTYRRSFGTPFYVEGWALYWEMLFWDLGYAQTPEDRIGMLFWRAHRAARIIVSLRFHLGEMTPDEMVAFLVERVGHERFGATSEVRRYIGDDYSPLYQCAYMIGGLQLRALRPEVVDSGRMTEHEFHDAFLTYGPIPIELIRADMLDVPLSADAKANWRFAGDP